MAKTFSMGNTIETCPKKTRQGKGKHTKYSATARNSGSKEIQRTRQIMFCRIRLKDTNYQEYHNYRILDGSSFNRCLEILQTICNL